MDGEQIRASGYGGAYRGPVAPTAAAAGLCVLLIGCAFLVRSRGLRPRSGPWRRGLTAVVFLCTATHFVTTYAIAATGLPWPAGVVVALAPIAIGVVVVVRADAGGDALRVVVGILSFFLLLDAVVGLGGRYDLTVAAVVTAIALRRLVKRTSPEPTDAGSVPRKAT